MLRAYADVDFTFLNLSMLTCYSSWLLFRLKTSLICLLTRSNCVSYTFLWSVYLVSSGFIDLSILYHCICCSHSSNFININIELLCVLSSWVCIHNQYHLLSYFTKPLFRIFFPLEPAISLRQICATISCSNRYRWCTPVFY